MDIDPQLLKQLIETFKIELEEQLQVITNGLLNLENSKSEGEKQQNITNIFRAAHNIKGTSRSLGITDLSTIAHHIESMFANIQNHKSDITANKIDLCLEAVDRMRQVMQAFIDKTTCPFKLEDLLVKLDQEEQEQEQKKPAYAEPSIQKETSKSETIHQAINPRNNKTNTLRVSTAAIDRLSALTEALQVSKISMNDDYHRATHFNAKANQLADIWGQLFDFLNFTELQQRDSLLKIYHLGRDYLTEMITLSASLNKNIRSHIGELSTLSNQLQDDIRTLRLVPFSQFFSTLPRYLHDLAQTLNKKVEITISGEDIKIDEMMLEKLKDPIIHLLRNAVDHGIESAEDRQNAGKNTIGKINLEVKEENNQIFIRFSDDGSGIDYQQVAKIAETKKLITKSELEKLTPTEQLDLIFKQGFSSKKIITDVSGRGVGLDVVKANIHQLGGQVSIETKLDAYTHFNLRIPLTIASERGLVFMSGGEAYVIPTRYVLHVFSAKQEDIIEVEGRQAVLFNHRPVLLQNLAHLLGMNDDDKHYDNLFVIFIQNADQQAALLVDEISGEREIVIKPLQAPLTQIPFVSGGTITGNNQVILVLSTTDLISSVLQAQNTKIAFKQTALASTSSRPRILVVDDSITTRTLEKNILESKNYDVTIAVNGKDAWDLLQKETFALVITDVMMPIMDGFTLTDHVKQSEKLQHIPVIIVTSLGSDAEKKRGIEVGADAYIVKNQFESSALLEVVEQLV